MVRIAMELTDHNQTRAARLLGVDRKALERRWQRQVAEQAEGKPEASRESKPDSKPEGKSDRLDVTSRSAGTPSLVRPASLPNRTHTFGVARQARLKWGIAYLGFRRYLVCLLAGGLVASSAAAVRHGVATTGASSVRTLRRPG